MSHRYYEQMRKLAHAVRDRYAITGPRVTRSDFHRIYEAEGITIDYWPRLKKLRGAYFHDELGPSVLISKSLPEDPSIFTLGHELKHHLVDRESGRLECSAGNASSQLEIGAEVFSAEFLFPDALFADLMNGMGVQKGKCNAESIARLKHDTKTTLSYTGLLKKAAWLGFAAKEAIPNKNWKSLRNVYLHQKNGVAVKFGGRGFCR
jgi:Zn-dependent peptidase ImmA (M78 family)